MSRPESDRHEAAGPRALLPTPRPGGSGPRSLGNVPTSRMVALAPATNATARQFRNFHTMLPRSPTSQRSAGRPGPSRHLLRAGRSRWSGRRRRGRRRGRRRSRADADGLAGADADGAAEALADADGSADALGLGVGFAVRNPPLPSSRAFSRIATNTATVTITKTFDQSSRTWTASSDAVGARDGAGAAPAFASRGPRRRQHPRPAAEVATSSPATSRTARS